MKKRNNRTESQGTATVLTEIARLKAHDFRVYFYVYDTKGTPSGSLAYIYDLALQFKEKGYDVRMLHMEKEFVGVGSWLGKEYAELPHSNIQKDAVPIGVSDFLFIPEINSNVMTEMKKQKLPCKKIAVLTNFGYMADTMRPLGVTWENLGIWDCVAASESLKERVLEVFPGTRVAVLKPRISNLFENRTKNKPLVVNIVAKNQSDVNAVLNPLHWKYREYGFIAVRDLRRLPQEDLAKGLDGSAVTVWIDDTTDIGYTALQSMACGSVVIGKIPENIPSWMDNYGELSNCGIWFYGMRDVQRALASFIQAYVYDSVDPELYAAMEKTVSDYRPDKASVRFDAYFTDGILQERIYEFEEVAGEIEKTISAENAKTAETIENKEE